jgi:hypothetical protein
MNMHLADQAEELVARELVELVPGYSVHRVPPQAAKDAGVDFELRPRRSSTRRARVVAVIVKTLGTLRVEDLLGRLAVGLLESRSRPRGHGIIPLIVVVVPAAGSRAWERAEEFMAAHAPDAGWAILDTAGSARVVIPPMKVDVRRHPARRPEQRRARHSTRLFSDLNSWMLKILLLPLVPPRLWGGPRARVSSPTELHRVAGVSPEAAHRLVRTFEARDFLRRDREGLRIVRRRELLDLWRVEVAMSVRPPVPVRWILGRPKGRAVDLRVVEPPDLVVGGFDACRRLGLLHAPVIGVEAHAVRPVDDVLAERRLERCAPHEADLAVLPCPTPQSVLRGSVDRKGVRVADALQAALDVAQRPERGREQSDYIIDRVLRLGEEG